MTDALHRVTNAGVQVIEAARRIADYNTDTDAARVLLNGVTDPKLSLAVACRLLSAAVGDIAADIGYEPDELFAVMLDMIFTAADNTGDTGQSGW